MTDSVEDIRFWLALSHAPGVGPVTYAKLLRHFDHPRTVFNAGVSAWKALGLKEELLNYLYSPNWEAVDKDIEWSMQPNSHILTLPHPHYPNRLRQIYDPPPLLFVRGSCELLSSNQVAVIGTRNPSVEGKKTAMEFCKYLSQSGFTITSGLAVGIDAAAHLGALAANGKTIAVAATGLDRVYPAEHRELAHKIAAEGALVSEFHPGTPPQVKNFPRRNRIISGLSLGSLVVEATVRSGALITARQAAEQGREVFAIPGSIHNPLTKGCHALIKEGAKLVETATDIIEELLIHLPITEIKQRITVPPVPNKVAAPSMVETVQAEVSYEFELVTESSLAEKEEISLADDYQRLLNHIGTEPVSIDTLVEISGLTASDISSMLLILELQGFIISRSGGLYTRIR